MKTHDGEISYEVVRSRRVTADIVIERDGRVLVRAPATVPDQKIEGIVEAKRYWIYKNLAEWRDLNATRVLREYRNGEGFMYLGRSYRLSLVTDQLAPLMLKDGDVLPPRGPDERLNPECPDSAFKEFYRKREPPALFRHGSPISKRQWTLWSRGRSRSST